LLVGMIGGLAVWRMLLVGGGC